MSLGQAFIPALLVAAAYAIVLPWCKQSSPWVRRTIVLVQYLLATRYWVWRTLETLPAPDVSLTCLVAYAFYALEGWILVVTFHSLPLSNRTRCRRDEATRNEGWHRELARPPLVDIFIPTYNEGLWILERTLVGAKGIDYERARVWLLDDGRRPEVRQLAERMQVHYLTRADNRHFKAGNLNNALHHVLGLPDKPDFVVVFDADFIARPTFLRRTLALMHDPKTVVVQTPQHFMNPDPVQIHFGGRAWWPDDMRFFMDYIQPCKDASDGVTCVGTSFLVRVSALQAIGGFPTESVSEDTLMSIKFMPRGWRTAYLNEQLSVGLAPENLTEYLRQRYRWQLGWVQITVSEHGILKGKRGLTHAFLYAEFILDRVIVCLYTWAVILMPLLYAFFDVVPFTAPPEEFLYYGLPMLPHAFAFRWLCHGTYLPPYVEEAHPVLLSTTWLKATISAIRKRDERFQVTAKGLSRSNIVIHWGVLKWIVLALFAHLLAMAYSAYSPESPVSNGVYGNWYYLWALQQVVVLLIAAIPCVEMPKYRADERVSTGERVRVAWGGSVRDVPVVDLSCGGVMLREQYPVGAKLSMTLEQVGEVEGTVLRRERRGCAVRFESTVEQRHALVRKLYCSPTYLTTPAEFRLFGVYRQILKKVLV